MKQVSEFVKRCPWLLMLLLPLVVGVALAQTETTAENAFANGNATALANLFNNTVELRILDEENVYAKQQAAIVLNAFFRKYPPQGFSVQHRNNRDDNSFTIGTLRSGTDSFRVSIFMKGASGSQKITQITITKASNF